MKREFKISESQIITISDNGAVTVPIEVRMSITEIANLFDIFYQTVKNHIRTIEKSGIAEGDYSMSCVVEGQKIYPDYYGLKMIIAIAFRVQSPQADIFRKWVLKKMRGRTLATFQNLEKECVFSLN